MRYLILLIVISSCSSFSIDRYKKEHHLEDFKSSKSAADVHALLFSKMKRCYPQSEYPAYKKTIASFNSTNNTGFIRYDFDTQSLGPRPLVYVEITNDNMGSLIRLFAKGDIFRPGESYKHHIQKWLNGKKVDCNSLGKI
jgi:hypothetical protein